MPVVGNLVSEIYELAESRDRLIDRTPEEMREAASDFARYRIRPLGAIKRSEVEAV